MKLKDIKVNGEYLSNGRQNWVTYRYDATRVRVLNLEVARWRADGKGGWRKNTGGLTGTTGLIVEVLHKETGEVQGQMVVTLASLRGEWAPTWKRVEDNHNSRIAFQEKQQKAKDAARDRVGIVLAKVKSFLGLTSDYETMRLVQDDYKMEKVLINVEFLDAMITELDKQGWKYTPGK